MLKYTGEDHPDRAAVERAVVAMRQVATHINEGKRRLENIGRIGMWQESIDGWKVKTHTQTHTHTHTLTHTHTHTHTHRVFFFDVSEESIRERVTLRRVDPISGERYDLIH